VGFEFECELGDRSSSETIRHLLDSLEADGRWRVLSRGERELALGYDGETGNPSWPESIVVNVKGSRVYVLFHAGTRSQREQFLEAVTTALESVGISCQLAEL
jgi:hypothetical protein